MNYKQSQFYQKLLAGTLAVFLLGFPFMSLKAQAQGFGKPRGSSSAGGVRGECFVTDRERPLTALVNTANATLRDRSEPALTTEGHPTFLFYLPYSQTPHRSPNGQVYKTAIAQFELLDENEQSVLKNQKVIFLIPENPGIVKLKLPDTENMLEPNKEYFWIFRIICDRNDNTANPSVAGWIKRVTVGSNPNIWFDRLKQLAQSQMNNLEQWKQILREVDPKLENLAQAPILELEPEPLGTSQPENNPCYNQLPTKTYGAQ